MHKRRTTSIQQVSETSTRLRPTGSILVFALVLVWIFGTLSTAGLTRSSTDLTASQLFTTHRQVFFAAESALDGATAQIRTSLTTYGTFPDVTAIQMLSCARCTYDSTVSHVAYLEQNPINEVIPAGQQYAGFLAQTKHVDITVRVVSASNPSVTETVREVVAVRMIPLFQYAIFDDGDLDLMPGQHMIINGPIFSNGRLGLQPEATLEINGTVGAAGDIVHGWDPAHADVLIQDANGIQRPMKNFDAMGNWNGTWLQSTDPTWSTDSQARWGGTVSAHQTKRLLPLPKGVVARDLVEVGDPVTDSQALLNSRYIYKAGLKIVDGVATDRNGMVVPLGGAVASKVFYDAREQKTVCATEIDVSQLMARGVAPQNGILYVGDHLNACAGGVRAVRLVNAGDLPAGGLTVVTHHPVYVQGNYNTVNNPLLQKSAAIIADAVTALSAEWTDANSLPGVGSPRVAGTSMTVNASVMAGQARDLRQPGNRKPSEHMIRFLEDWASNNLQLQFSFTGSEVALWDSKEVSSSLYAPDESSVYSPPIRVWTFNRNALTPPGTLFFYSTASVSWNN